VLKRVEAFNRGDVDAIPGLYADGAVNHQVAESPVEGKDAIREMFAKELSHARMNCIVERIFEDGEWAIREWRAPHLPARTASAKNVFHGNNALSIASRAAVCPCAAFQDKPRLRRNVMTMIKIKPYSAHRAAEIADLFHQAVHAIDRSLYTAEQKEAWAPTPPDYEHWKERLNEKRPFVAVIDDRVAGFMELDADGHIDCTYTHPRFQGLGVASALYEHLLAEARGRGVKRLYVEASLKAKPFFEHRGFSVVTKNEVRRRGIPMVNFTMELYL
jgi:putative acetyltransferase